MSHIALMAIRWDGWVFGRDTQGRGEAWPLEIQGWEICHVPYARLRSDERKRGNHQIKIKKKNSEIHGTAGCGGTPNSH